VNLHPSPEAIPPGCSDSSRYRWGTTSTGVVGLLIPYLLRKHGVSLDHIAEVIAIAGIPLMWSVVAAPVVDLGLPRRIWVMFSAAASGLMAAAAIVFSTGSLPFLTFLLFITHATITLLNSANGGLMSAVPTELRGRVGGSYQAGNQGAGALAGGGLIWLAHRVALPWLALLTPLFIIGPALAAFWIHETPHTKLAVRVQFSALLRDLRDVLSARRTWIDMVFFLSPAGIGAGTGLISRETEAQCKRAGREISAPVPAQHCRDPAGVRPPSTRA
jgi:MFS family permease